MMAALRSVLTSALLLLPWPTVMAATKGAQPQTPLPCCLTAVPQSDTRGTAQQPLIVNATLPAKTADEKTADTKEQAWRHKIDVWTLVASGATILVLIAQGIAFVFQAHRLKQSVHEMKRATEATRTMAVAEQATVDTMARTARRELKAYVFVETQEIAWSGSAPPGESVAVAKVFLKNYGQTPAYGLRVLLDVVTQPEFKPREPAAPLQPAGTLGPGATFKTEVQFRMPDARHADLREGRTKLFVYGRVEYEDAFKEPRWLNYRLMSAAAMGQDWRQLVSCAEGNESDPPE